MIGGKERTEGVYRDKIIDSSSSLKDVADDRKKYHKRHVLGQKVKEDHNQSINMGRLVETELMEPDTFDSKFYLSSCVSVPTGLGYAFVTAMTDLSIASMDEEGTVTREFKDIAQEAYSMAGYKIPFETVIKKFYGSDLEIYFNELMMIEKNDLTTVTLKDVDMSKTIVETLKENPVTKDIVTLITSVRYSVWDQYPVEGYEIDGLPMKGLMDKVIVDHDLKLVKIYDLKCVWAVERFYEEYYLKRKAYIQAYVYYTLMKMLAQDPESEVYGYEVLTPEFIVCDSSNYMNPLVFTTSEQDIVDAYEGFTYKYREYPGVKSIIEDLKWALEFDIWNISRENYLNKGMVPITN